MVKVQLAGIPVQMNNRFPELEVLCRDYLTEEGPVITLSATQKEIEAERAMQDAIFTDGYLETICLYRKLARVWRCVQACRCRGRRRGRS